MRKWLAPVCAVAVSMLLISGCGGAIAPPEPHLTMGTGQAPAAPGPAPTSDPGPTAPLSVPEATPPQPTPPAPNPPAPAPVRTTPPPTPPPTPPAPSSTYDPYRDGAPPLEPADPIMPPPAEVAERWQPLDQTVREVAAAYKGRISVVAVDLTTGARYDFRPNDRYYPASTFKLPLSLCVVQAIERGELTWETPIIFTEADDEPVGAGRFAEAEYGSHWSVRNLVERALISSNNVAAKMLSRTLTFEALGNCTAAMGGMVTRDDFGSTPVSAPDEAAWWLTLYQMHQEKPALADNLLRPLRRVDYEGRIMAGTPRPDLVTHKYGTFPPYEHDGAIIWGERPYVLVVMAHGGTHEDADQAIIRISGAAWNAVYR